MDEQGHDSGWGSGYVGTVNGVDVYSTALPGDRSILYSANMLQSIAYSPVANNGGLVTVELEEGDNPFGSTIVVRFCQTTNWADSPVVEINLQDQ
jgi:hypothetical protein